MNINLIVFSGLVSCTVGLMVGIGLAEINRGDSNPQAASHYAAIGAVAGLAIGAGQEILRELKQQEDTD
ncbi:hypothetical protein [Lyngbya aestuarii]|uniref:hypothetical protein n=1 Tax=Lyngbya aestuarii TaxID=118322 RepID=UPI00403D7F29